MSGSLSLERLGTLLQVTIVVALVVLVDRWIRQRRFRMMET